MDFTLSSSAEIGLVGQDTEVSAKARRRQFTAEYKRKVLAEVEACTKPGEIGALLRREGLYSLSRLALTDRAWFGETDRDLGVIGMGELSMVGVASVVRPS